MTEPPLLEPAAPRVPLPPPGPRSRPADPPLPAEPSPTPPPEPAPTRGPRSLFARSGQRTDDTTATPPPGTGSTGGDRPRRRFSWKPSGDPGDVAEVIAGLLIVTLGGLAALVARGGRRQLRKPTKAQADALGAPLAGITCRHLPMGLLSPDLKDLGMFAGALQDYLEGAEDQPPLITRLTDLGARP